MIIHRIWCQKYLCYTKKQDLGYDLQSGLFFHSQQPQVKLLAGFIINSKLTSGNHTVKVFNKLARAFHFLRRLKPMLTKQYLLTAYFALYHSHLIAMMVWRCGAIGWLLGCYFVAIKGQSYFVCWLPWSLGSLYLEAWASNIYAFHMIKTEFKYWNAIFFSKKKYWRV